MKLKYGIASLALVTLVVAGCESNPLNGMTGGSDSSSSASSSSSSMGMSALNASVWRILSAKTLNCEAKTLNCDQWRLLRRGLQK